MAGGCRSIRDNLLLVLFNGLADGDVQSGVSAESVGAGAAQGCPGGEGVELVVGHVQYLLGGEDSDFGAGPEVVQDGGGGVAAEGTGAQAAVASEEGEITES